MASKNKFQRTQRVPGWIHIALIILLSISFYATGEGYSAVLPAFASYAFALAVIILIYASTIDLGNRIIRNQSIGRPVIFIVLASLITFSGNFNAFFTKFQTETIYRQELTLHKNELNELQSNTTKAIATIIAPEVALENEVNKLYKQLETQVLDPQRSGFGQRAKALLAEISNTLGQPLTELSTTKPQVALDGYKKQIDEILKARKNDTAYRLALNLAATVTQETKEQIEQIDSVLLSGSSKRIKDEGYGLIQKSVDVYNKLRTDVDTFVNDKKLFNMQPTTFAAEEIGKIDYSLKTGFRDYLSTSLFITFFSFFIDLAAALYLIFMFRSKIQSLTEEDHIAQYQKTKGRSSLD
ncbi:hypothetical protein CKF54_04130 [Psittacicella hinzii]|uniref:Uncharacterized protein n=1 Tax=Psittacicella hinzii TaxID=2028575 RepID=A0A3A1Y6P7_9GAMM|nr:hypothetical protein [Psittacicella hinzii]RIY32888.1 hypothetical protein CKF54_04130 [Psittacicella hinzii]